MKEEKKYWLVDLDVEHFRSFTWFRTPERKKKWFYWLRRFREGGRFAEEWEPPYLRLYEGELDEEDIEVAKPIPDFINGFINMACSQRAKEVIEPLVGEEVEFLPLRTEVGPYWEMNLPRISCLDEARAEVKRFPSSGRIMEVVRFAFRWEAMEGHHLFWVRETGMMYTLASEAFRRLVEEHGLTGLVFEEIPLVPGERPPWETHADD